MNLEHKRQVYEGDGHKRHGYKGHGYKEHEYKGQSAIKYNWIYRICRTQI